MKNKAQNSELDANKRIGRHLSAPCKHCGSEIDATHPDYCPECGMLAPERFAQMKKTVMLIDVAITEFTLIARGKETNQENWDDFWEHAPQEGDRFWEGYGCHRYLILEDQYGEVLAEKYFEEEMILLDVKGDDWPMGEPNTYDGVT